MNNPLRGRRGKELAGLLRCAVNGGRLRLDDMGHLVSEDAPTIRYTVEDGVLRLGREDELALLAQKSAIKTQHYRNEGRSVTNEETFRRLPQTGLGGWPLGYWQRRAFVTAEMWRVLEAARIEAQQLPIAPMGTAVDFTDGMGWLGYGLDVAGYLTVVVGEDTGAYGLGAFPYTRYLRVQALNWGLVAPNSCDLVVFSFSVAGLDDPAKLIERACASLKVGGHLIVLADKAENRQDGEKFHAAETALKATGYPLEKRRVSAMGRKFSRLLKNTLRYVPDVPPLLVLRRP